MILENEAESVSAHYTSNDLTTKILAALKAAGKNLEALSSEDLVLFDQLHTGGKSMTLQLAQLASIEQGMSVLDIGGGLGGPARVLADAFKCYVTMLDLTAALCETGQVLTRLTGLDRFVTFQQGNACAMPLGNDSFDVVWMQHSSMNISDKERLYREVYRVLRPGGKLAFHEVMAGPNQPVHFPVPWAKDASISFLGQPEEMRALLYNLGFKELIWRDVSAASVKAIKERSMAAQNTSLPSTLGMHLILGNNFNQAVKSAFLNLEEQRITAIEALFQKS